MIWSFGDIIVTLHLGKKMNTTMKKTISMMVALAISLQVAVAQEVMRREKNGNYVINTTTLAPEVKGFRGATPLEITIGKNKIVEVKPLANKETPRYFQLVKKQMLPKYAGQRVSKKQMPEVDAVTGATFSSRAVKENVRRGVAYYLKNK